MLDITITQDVHGHGTLILFDRQETSDGRVEITKRIECRVEGEQVKLLFEHTTTNTWHDISSTATSELQISVEDFIALIQAYIEIIA